MIKLKKAIILASSMFLSLTSYAQAKDVTIYGVSSESGAFANFGKQGSKGLKLAVDAADDAAGMKFNYSIIDSESNAGKAARKVKAAISKSDARYFIGSTLSSTALAVGKEVDKAGGIYINGSGADEITGTQCNKAMFRWSAPTYGAVNASLIPVLDLHPEIKRVYTITPDYVFGEAMLNNAKIILKKRGIELVGNSYHSLKEKEFSGYLSQAMATKADLLLVLNFGSLATNTLLQADSFGMKDKMQILLVWSSGLDHFRTLTPKVAEGIYFGSQYWHEDESPANKAFVALSREKLKETPNYPMAHYYQMTKLLIDSMNATKSADPDAIRKHLEGLEYDGLTGREFINAENHQVEKYFYLLQGKKASEMKDPDNYANIISKAKYFLPANETGCKM
ncbi:MAG: ABC transporter substrate-binding protein [Methylocystaceae bacterium]|nr:ABC transporter substrate-binding protein [Methylocystaceae bacterium]